MNAAELCGSLGVEAAELEAWMAEGLPCRDSGSERFFDPAQVSAWLIERGYAEGERDSADLVFATQREAAEWIGVCHDTLARGWRARGMPGEPGRYSAREIARWLAQRYAQGSGAENDTLNARRLAETRKLEADADLREFKLKLEKGRLVDVDQVQLEASEALAKTRDVLMRVPAELRPMLPPECAEEVVSTVDGHIRRTLTMLYHRLCELGAADQDEEAGEAEGGD